MDGGLRGGWLPLPVARVRFFQYGSGPPVSLYCGLSGEAGTNETLLCLCLIIHWAEIFSHECTHRPQAIYEEHTHLYQNFLSTGNRVVRQYCHL